MNPYKQKAYLPEDPKIIRGVGYFMDKLHRWVMLLVLVTFFLAATAVAGAEWWSYRFQPGQHLMYDMSWEQDGIERVGTLEVRVQESSDGYLYIIMLGEFDEGEPFAFSADVDPEDPDDIFFQVAMNLMTEVPEEVGELIFGTLWLPWFDLPMHGDTFDQDWGFYDEDEDGTVFSMSVTGTDTFGGMEGTVVHIDAEGDLGAKMDVCINNDVPLPIMVSVFDVQEWHELGESMVGAVLTLALNEFQIDAEPLAEVPMGNIMWQQARPTGVLAQLIDHFEAEGFEISLMLPNNFEQLGAADGLWVEIEGDDMELFWFDRDQATEETLQRLAEAEATGEFHYGTDEMGMRMTGIVRGDIFLAGLAFEPIYIHPHKEDIEAAFVAFEE